MHSALPSISVIIVNYHTPEAIDTALEVLLAGDDLDIEVVLVDQEPTPQERTHHTRWEQRPSVRVVTSPTNLGFAGGCNLGSEHAKHDWLLFLNSDAWMTQEHVAVMLQAAVERNAVAAGPLSNRASDVQTMYEWNAFRQFTTPDAYRSYRHEIHDAPFAYHRLSGVCLLVRTDAFDRVGRFEPSYGLGYFEDDELTVRLARTGTLLVVPAAFVYHQDGLSWRRTGRHERGLAMYVNRMRYLFRNCTDILEAPRSSPLVTVVVTTFNRRELLKRALQSIADQSYREIEVIVVNDAGAPVGDVVEQSLGSCGVKWTYLENAVNVGKPASINHALEASSGELIAYLDDDDEYLPDHLLAAVNALAVDDGLDAVYFGSISSKVADGDRVVAREVVSNEWDVLRLLSVNLLPNCSLVHRRRLLDLVGGYGHLEAIEDWDFLRRASLVGTFLHLPLVTSTFRVRADGKSRNGLARRNFGGYASVERRVRLSAPALSRSVERAPAAWSDVIGRALRPIAHQDKGGLANLQAATGLPSDTIAQLRPDLVETHLSGSEPEAEHAYAALLASSGVVEQTASLAALIQHYLRQGNVGAVSRLHAFLSYTVSGSELSGSGNPVQTARRVFEREGLRGLREVSILSAKRRSRQLVRRLQT